MENRNGKTGCLQSHLCLLIFLSICGTATAQLHLKVNLQNMHLWRGMEVTDGMVITTDLSVTDKSKRFRAGVWGGASMDGSYKEFNNYLSYTSHRFGMAIWDIFNFSPGANYNNKDFFNYKAGETGRFVDATVSYTVSEEYPLFMSWATILYGRDRDGLNAQNRYSTFVYTEYPVYCNEQWEVKPGIGTAFAFSQGKDANGMSSTSNFYGDKAGIVHISVSTTYYLTVFKHDFPITVLALWNPQSNKGYLQIGIQLISL